MSSCIRSIGGALRYVLNVHGTGYEYSIPIELNGAHHLKDHPKINKFAKFESFWSKRKGMVHF